MGFNTITFLIFFPLVFLLYWGVRRFTRVQTLLLLIASWIFYGWWDWRYLGLLIGITFSTYITALLTSRAHNAHATTRSKAPLFWTALNIMVCVATLAAFKYFNFFSENLKWLFATFGWEIDWFTLEVLLPIGISFYTFQSIGYSVDVYKRDVDAERDPMVFATFLAYFPQLVAGPIERASSLIPQLRAERRWDYSRAVDGCRQALWGMFKKLAIADAAGLYVDNVFADVERFYASGAYLTIFLGTALFTIQVYCDFSGYCDIARGLSRCLGIEIMQNFRFPLFSRTAPEIWRRWNASLGLWFRDYIYIPLGGSRRGDIRTFVNIFIVLLISGLWHGANWMCVLWGVYWGVVCGVAHVVRRRLIPGSSPYGGIPATCALLVLSLAIFRAQCVADILPAAISTLIILVPLAAAGEIAIALWWKASRPMRRACALALPVILLIAALYLGVEGVAPWLARWTFVIWIVIMFWVEWANRELTHGLEKVPSRGWLRTLAYVALLLVIMTSTAQPVNFIYYQF